MLYMSNDGKHVFKNEQVCLEYEQKIKQEMLEKEKLKKKQKERYENIIKHIEEVIKEIQDYEKNYGSLKLSISNNNYDYNKIMNLFSNYDMIMQQPEKYILSRFFE